MKRLAHAGLRARMRYAFDNTMARGTSALIGWLALASGALVVVFATATVVFAPRDAAANGHWPGMLWRGLMRAMDPGTVAGDTGSPVYLGLMLATTVGGIFIFSALIGVLTNGLDDKLADLRRGRSRIIERDHTVLLGWSDQVFTVVSELVTANESERRSCVAILADRDTVDMEQDLRDRLGRTGRTRVVCRRGNPLAPADLELVSPDSARSIMVVAPPIDDPDTHVIKVLLSLGARTWAGARPPVVASVADPDNLPAARLAGGPDADVIDADDLAARLVVQSHRQAGLSTVCAELLSFDGQEFYMRREPALTGCTYREALTAYELGIPVGIRSADGTVAVNPPVDTVIADGDELIMLAEDDTLIRPAGARPPIADAAIATREPQPEEPTRTLLIGWNGRAAKIISLLDGFAEPGSTLDIAAPHDDPRPELAPPRNLTIGFTACDPTSRAALERLKPGRYEHVIVLADGAYAPQHADARSLVTLLHLRDIAVRLGDPYSIVSEINDDANREVAQVTKADDFIVSKKLISLLLTQLTENRHMREVYAELLSPEGSELYLKPAADYVLPGAAANFATIIESAQRRGHTAIGYRLGDGRHRPPDYGIVLNPDKAAPLTLTTEDQVVVLAEN